MTPSAPCWRLRRRRGGGVAYGTERENFRLYVPLATSLLASAVLSLILWLINR
jgi:hypothetical protein